MKDTRPEVRGAMRRLPYMGVIAVVAAAEKLGFYNGHPDWINLGQGQPEVGPMEGAPPRVSQIRMEPIDHAYGPVHGTPELRQRIAEHYNRLYRRGMPSQYTAENVAVCSGGRLALARAVFAMAPCKVGYMVPDYSAYEDLLGGQSPRLDLHPVLTREENGFALTSEEMAAAVRDDGVEAFIISNPCNPTGVVVEGDELAAWVSLAREASMTLLADEFYSHFHYGEGGGPASGPVSAAAYVEDVEEDPVLIFDGLTKSFRYPGWRIGWVVGPQALIECFITAGSSMDGGPPRAMQRAALEVLRPEQADEETAAVRHVFAAKRDLMVRRLRDLGLTFAREPRGTFYCWASIAGLAPPFNDADVFFEEALKRKVLTVPGYYFDIDPGRHRDDTGTLDQWMRFSFGPPMDDMVRGLDRLEEMLG